MNGTGRLVLIVAAGLLVLAGCRGGGHPWHMSVSPDTKHDDLAGYERWFRSSTPGQPTSLGGYPYPDPAGSKAVLDKIDCRPDPLRSWIDEDAHNPEVLLWEQLPIPYFKCGRSAVVQALNDLGNLPGRDRAWVVLQKYGA